MFADEIKVEVFRVWAKGRKPLWLRKILASLSSRSSRNFRHSLSARVSTSVRAAERETKLGKRYWLVVRSLLAADLACLSVVVILSSPPCPGVHSILPLMSFHCENSWNMLVLK